MKSSLIFVLAAVSSIFAAESEAKLEAGCKPCAQPCPPRCSEATLLQAAQILVNDLCAIFETTSLVQLQTLVTQRSTLETVFLANLGCVDSGVVNFLSGAIPLLPVLSCANAPIVTSSYIDINKRVVVFAEGQITLSGELINVKARYTFESINGGCELQLVDALIRQVECI